MAKSSGTTRSSSKESPRGLSNVPVGSIVSATARAFSAPVLATAPTAPAGPTDLEKALANTKTKRIQYDDDLVRVFNEKGKQVYSGMEDYDPNKDLDWRYDPESGTYKYRNWTKIAIA